MTIPRPVGILPLGAALLAITNRTAERAWSIEQRLRDERKDQRERDRQRVENMAASPIGNYVTVGLLPFDQRMAEQRLKQRGVVA